MVMDVTPREIRSDAQRIEELAADYDKEIQKFMDAKDRLQGTVFSGAQAEAFKKKVEEFRDDFQKMSTRMKAYASYLKDSASTIEAQIQNEIDRANAMKG